LHLFFFRTCRLSLARTMCGDCGSRALQSRQFFQYSISSSLLKYFDSFLHCVLCHHIVLHGRVQALGMLSIAFILSSIPLPSCFDCEIATKFTVTYILAILWEWCTKGIKQKRKACVEFSSRIKSDPIELLKVIKEHRRCYQEYQCPLF
jgi:hypothetical protein